ncbi:YchJ family protein [Microbacterium sp.]|uniref:YchJ family protein n=1 Tax=Microbacterium sp. TaxID=51671 RepID=UPI003F7263F3
MRPDAASPCPCGSGVAFDGCCAPILAGTAAETPEALMRSRYTAYAIGDLAHVAGTWHPGTAPERIDPTPGLRWTGLEVIDAVTGEKRGAVEFRAQWREGRVAGELHERSRFVRQSGRWWYLDRDVR